MLTCSLSFSTLLSNPIAGNWEPSTCGAWVGRDYAPFPMFLILSPANKLQAAPSPNSSPSVKPELLPGREGPVKGAGRAGVLLRAQSARTWQSTVRMADRLYAGGEDYTKEFDPADYLRTYYAFDSGPVAENEILKFNLENLFQTFSAGE